MLLQDNRAELTLPALREEFPRLHDWLESITAELTMPLRASQQLLIAADEIFTNIAAYAYPGGNGSVSVIAEHCAAGRAFKLHFFDAGIAFDPLTQAAPDTSVPLEERTLGGLGISVVRRLMDLVEYERVNGQNHLTLTKNFVPAPGGNA